MPGIVKGVDTGSTGRGTHYKCPLHAEGFTVPYASGGSGKHVGEDSRSRKGKGEY